MCEADAAQQELPLVKSLAVGVQLDFPLNRMYPTVISQTVGGAPKQSRRFAHASGQALISLDALRLFWTGF